MTVKEVVKILEENKVDFIILDDPRCNPIEVLFFLNTIPETLKSESNRFGFIDGDRKRIIVLQTFKEAGLAEWYHKKQKNISDLSSEDIAFLWLDIAYCLTNRASWLRNNIIFQHTKCLMKDEKGVEDFFCRLYIEKRCKD